MLTEEQKETTALQVSPCRQVEALKHSLPMAVEKWNRMSSVRAVVHEIRCRGSSEIRLLAIVINNRVDVVIGMDTIDHLGGVAVSEDRVTYVL